MLQAVIFDLDGTLVESESIWIEVTRRIVESFGKVFDPSFHQHMRGAGSRNAMRLIKERFDLPATIDQLDDMNRRFYSEAVEHSLPTKRAGADELIDALTQAGVPFALATGADRQEAEHVLSSHGWLEKFSAIVTIDDVTEGKPSPQTFAEAARRLACEPRCCVAFEDGPSGVKSAVTAGMKVIGIAEPGVDLVGVERLISSFTEITLADLQGIVSDL